MGEGRFMCLACLCGKYGALRLCAKEQQQPVSKPAHIQSGSVNGTRTSRRRRSGTAAASAAACPHSSPASINVPNTPPLCTSNRLERHGDTVHGGLEQTAAHGIGWGHCRCAARGDGIDLVRDDGRNEVRQCAVHDLVCNTSPSLGCDCEGHQCTHRCRACCPSRQQHAARRARRVPVQSARPLRSAVPAPPPAPIPIQPPVLSGSDCERWRNTPKRRVSMAAWAFSLLLEAIWAGWLTESIVVLAGAIASSVGSGACSPWMYGT